MRYPPAIVSWFRYKSIEEGQPRAVCPVCGHSNRRYTNSLYNTCSRCFHDATTGRRSAGQVVIGIALLASSLAVAGMFGAFVTLVLVQLPLDIFFGLDFPQAAGTRKVVAPLVALAGVAGGLWVAERVRSREVVTPPEQPTPRVRLEKRVDKRFARMIIPAVFAFAAAMPLEPLIEEAGAPEWAAWMLYLGAVVAGAAAGNAYDAWRRSGGGR